MYAEILFISLGRDPFSMTSHLLGALLALVATYILVRRARSNGLRGLGVGIYGCMMTLVFGASALFHYVDPGSARLELYQKIDHLAIFLMIAGTATAIYGPIKASWADMLTVMLWAITVVGITIKLLFWPLSSWVTALMYLSVGWLGCIGLFRIGHVAGWESLRLFVFGGIAFSAGAVIFALGWPPIWIGAHAVFHLLVLLGAALHFGFIYQYCTQPAAIPL